MAHKERGSYLTFAPGLFVVPMVRGRVAFCSEVRRAFAETKPDCLLVELPRPLRAEIVAALSAGPPRGETIAWHTADGWSLALPMDPGDATIEAVRIALETKVPFEPIDSITANAGAKPPALPDPDAVLELGLDGYAAMAISALEGEELGAREQRLAKRIMLYRDRYATVLAVLELRTAAALQRMLRGGLGPGKLDPDSPPEALRTIPAPTDRHGMVLHEMPRLLAKWEEYRAKGNHLLRFPLRRALRAILREAAEAYRDRWNETISMTEWRALFQFGRNLAVLRGSVRPGLVELVQAASGCVDDDFGEEVFRRLTTFGDEPEPQEEEEVEEPADRTEGGRLRRRALQRHVDFGEEFGVRRLEAAYPAGDIAEVSFRFRKRPPSRAERRGHMAKWLRSILEGRSGICSWPPEDEQLEAFLRRVRKTAWERLVDRNETIEEFQTNLGDGLALRETMRDVRERKLYIRRHRQPRGRIGPVVVVWHEAHLAEPDFWRTTLYAENHNESDIAVACSPIPGGDAVGPGIVRTFYHAMLSVYPPRHIPDVWQDTRFLARWHLQGRALMACAVLLAEERYIAVLSREAPDAELREFARAQGREFIHLPIGLFSRQLLRRVSRVHILNGHPVRDWASGYIDMDERF